MGTQHFDVIMNHSLLISILNHHRVDESLTILDCNIYVQRKWHLTSKLFGIRVLQIRPQMYYPIIQLIHQYHHKVVG